MKPALYFAIRVKTFYPYVVAVTSEKDSRYGHKRWYGRDTRHNEATNGTTDDLRGRFETQEKADSLRLRIATIANEFDAKRKVLHDQVSVPHREEREAVDALFAA